MSEYVKTNFPQKQREIKDYVKALDKKYIKRAMHLALMEVSFTSVKDYMIETGDVIQAAGQGVDPDFLTMRTGRLARSIMSVPSFGEVELPTAVEMMLQAKPHGKNIVPKEGAQEGIKRIFVHGKSIEGVVGSEVPYAKKHEEGINIKARPFLNPAAKDAMPTVRKIFEQTLIQTFEKRKI